MKKKILLHFHEDDYKKKINTNIKSWYENVEQLELSYIASGMQNMVEPLGKEYGNTLQSYIYLLYDSAFPLLCVYPRETKIYIHIKMCDHSSQKLEEIQMSIN